ncbi:MAG TPA: class I SAM-dependent methyltransferase [Saprospiraceae bacterium]|nr:class I SAM-dependent methyltransferase [Saprospiraceae bacterium]HPN68080.1 class I SAM-dependent methyltransferase [Saprospiraceae bacterium]
MLQDIRQTAPSSYFQIDNATKENGFTMPSDILTCSLLRTLAAAKPNAKFLELGTGTGLSTAWILDGMDSNSTLISIDNDPVLLQIASNYLDEDQRLTLVETDGEDWVLANKGAKFDFIFADTWHGKYLMLDEVLDMISPGGFYIVDDMIPQENWPDGHHQKAIKFVDYLDTRSDLFVTKQDWATGIIVAVKRV